MASKNPLLAAQKITVHGFVNEFKRRHDQMADRPFCWILGSGASVQSRIPTGEELAMQWLKELHELEDFDQRPIQEWATAENLEIPEFNFGRAADFYPWIYQRRFRDYKEQGYAFLEKAMDHTEPSFGYSVLAQIMATTSHKVAITTNFDNLIADALSSYARIFPLVCGHESVTGCIRANLRRPIIAKIHRDLLLSPWSNPENIAKLSSEWATALTRIFERFTPIVIGCGGSDGSLMSFLKALTPIEGGIFWCHHEANGIEPSVHEVILQHRGRLVPINGFDELMLQLQEKLQLSSLRSQSQRIDDARPTEPQKPAEIPAETLSNAAEKKIVEPAPEPAPEPVREQIPTPPPARELAPQPAREPASEPANKPILQVAQESAPAPVAEQVREPVPSSIRESAPQPVDALVCDAIRESMPEPAPQAHPKQPLPQPAPKAAEVPVERFTMEKDWWAWKLKADAEPEPTRKEAILRAAIEDFPESHELFGKLAVFMEEVRMNYDEAERLYQRALELNPKHANNTGNFAVFMKNVRKDYDEAERLYRRALELDPKHVVHTGNFAVFMEDVRMNYAEAERLYKKASEMDPQNAWIRQRYETFRKEHPVFSTYELGKGYIEDCRACDARIMDGQGSR